MFTSSNRCQQTSKLLSEEVNTYLIPCSGGSDGFLYPRLICVQASGRPRRGGGVVISPVMALEHLQTNYLRRCYLPLPPRNPLKSQPTSKKPPCLYNMTSLPCPAVIGPTGNNTPDIFQPIILPKSPHIVVRVLIVEALQFQYFIFIILPDTMTSYFRGAGVRQWAEPKGNRSRFDNHLLIEGDGGS